MDFRGTSRPETDAESTLAKGKNVTVEPSKRREEDKETWLDRRGATRAERS